MNPCGPGPTLTPLFNLDSFLLRLSHTGLRAATQGLGRTRHARHNSGSSLPTGATSLRHGVRGRGAPPTRSRAWRRRLHRRPDAGRPWAGSLGNGQTRPLSRWGCPGTALPRDLWDSRPWQAGLRASLNRQPLHPLPPAATVPAVPGEEAKAATGRAAHTRCVHPTWRRPSVPSGGAEGTAPRGLGPPCPWGHVTPPSAPETVAGSPQAVVTLQDLPPFSRAQNGDLNGGGTGTDPLHPQILSMAAVFGPLPPHRLRLQHPSVPITHSQTREVTTGGLCDPGDCEPDLGQNSVNCPFNRGSRSQGHPHCCVL